MRRKLIINDKQGEAWQMYMVIAYGYSGYISVLLYNPIGRRGTRGWMQGTRGRRIQWLLNAAEVGWVLRRGAIFLMRELESWRGSLERVMGGRCNPESQKLSSLGRMCSRFYEYSRKTWPMERCNLVLNWVKVGAVTTSAGSPFHLVMTRNAKDLLRISVLIRGLNIL